MSTALAHRDAERLADLEVTIAQGLTTFVEVGAALAEIRDTRLYRQTHAAFEDYCRERWSMGRSYVNKMIAASEVVANLGTTVPNAPAELPLPATESQARPLASLPPETQREVWQKAVETAPEGKVTAAHVVQTVERVTRPLFIDKPDTPGVIPISRKTDALEAADEQEMKDLSVVAQTVQAARVEFNRSEEGRLAAYISALPTVPGGIGDAAFRGLHAVSLEVLRIHAAFINRAIAQGGRSNGSAKR